jgi:predicted transcriptional regulator
VAPSERELDVLKVLWELGESRVRDIHQALNAGRPCAFTTVQTLLRIMADKGLVKQRQAERTLYYSAKYSREQASSRFLHKVFDGALDELVLSMLQAENVSAEDMKSIEQLISRARKRRSDAGGK